MAKFYRQKGDLRGECTGHLNIPLGIVPVQLPGVSLTPKILAKTNAVFLLLLNSVMRPRFFIWGPVIAQGTCISFIDTPPWFLLMPP